MLHVIQSDIGMILCVGLCLSACDDVYCRWTYATYSKCPNKWMGSAPI